MPRKFELISTVSSDALRKTPAAQQGARGDPPTPPAAPHWAQMTWGQ